MGFLPVIGSVCDQREPTRRPGIEPSQHKEFEMDYSVCTFAKHFQDLTEMNKDFYL